MRALRRLTARDWIDSLAAFPLFIAAGPMPMKPTSPLFSSFGTTIFEVMSVMARAAGAVNLGQGFPDGRGPDDIRAAAADALLNGHNQYPPMFGMPVLREAVAHHAQRFHGLTVDAAQQVIVSSGATEGLAASLFGLLAPGDEAVVIEPAYDSYAPIIRQAGATVRTCRLAAPGWQLERATLEAAFSPRTKLLVLNNPHNPAGKVFSAAELAVIADVVQRYDAYVVCDEVYEHLVFTPDRHIPLASLVGMADRCVRIGSAGKTFALTGWKVGYVTCPPAVFASIAKAHQYLTFTTPPNLQTAVAQGLAKDDAYFETLAAELMAKRDRLAAGLARIGFTVLPAQGTYFLTVDAAAAGLGDDRAAAELLCKQARVASVPLSAFYLENAPTRYLRFCFCKDDATLDEAISRLSTFMARRAVTDRPLAAANT